MEYQLAGLRRFGHLAVFTLMHLTVNILVLLVLVRVGRIGVEGAVAAVRRLAWLHGGLVCVVPATPSRAGSDPSVPRRLRANRRLRSALPSRGIGGRNWK